MKKSYILIALAMVAALSMVSCKNNNKKVQSQEPTQEEVQQMKQALADSVLADIDALAEEYFVASENGFHVCDLELTEQEKTVKPDYLLDPAEANNFVTKSQKINALAIYVMELGVRRIYDMPLEETKEVIAKLAAEVNYHFDMDAYEANTPASERIKMEYENCKENGDQASFWQFKYAVIVETTYLLAQNSDLFFSKINEEQWQNFHNKYAAAFMAIEELAKYDEEMANLMNFIEKHNVASSKEEAKTSNATIESAKQYRTANKDKYIAKRNALLQ